MTYTLIRYVSNTYRLWKQSLQSLPDLEEVDPMQKQKSLRKECLKQPNLGSCLWRITPSLPNM